MNLIHRLLKDIKKVFMENYTADFGWEVYGKNANYSKLFPINLRALINRTSSRLILELDTMI